MPRMCPINPGVPPQWFELREILKALRFPTRWVIIEFLGNGDRGTEEIYEHILSLGEEISKSGLYYHLSELRGAGIIDVAEYREEGKGAPEKVWRLAKKSIVIDLVGHKEQKAF